MAEPRWGNIRVSELPDGRYVADAYHRDELGVRRRYQARGSTKAIARELLFAKAEAAREVGMLVARSTVAELAG